jgi:predicted ABC-type ATPase
LEVNKTGAKKGRRYDKPERFMSTDQVQTYLKDQDRRQLSVEIFDPLTGQRVVEAQGSMQKVELKERELQVENLKRARQRMEQAEARYQELKANPARTTAEELEFAQVRSRHNALSSNGRVQTLEQETQDLVRAREASSTAINGQMKGKTPTERKELIAQMQRERAEFDRQIDENRDKLQRMYIDMLGGQAKWNEIALQGKVNDQNMIKFIYVIGADGKPVFGEEVINGAASGRAAHSELAQGHNVYGAGEVAFTKNADGQWVLTEINNGSGHYLPPAETLVYVRNVLSESGLDTSHAILNDALVRGTPIVEADLFNLDEAVLQFGASPSRAVPQSFDGRRVVATELPPAASQTGSQGAVTYLSTPGKYGDKVESFGSVKARKVEESFLLKDGTQVNEGDYIVTDQNDLTYVVPRAEFDNAYITEANHESIVRNQNLFASAVERDEVIKVKKQHYEVRISKVTGDEPILIETLEQPDGEIVHPGQFVVQRLDKFGFPVIERGMVNEWPVSEVAKLAKTYDIDTTTLDNLNADNHTTTAFTRTDGPPVHMVQIQSDDFVIDTKWGQMKGKKGDWLANYDFESGQPGTDFSIISKEVYDQIYGKPTEVPFQPVGRPGIDYAIVTDRSFDKTYEPLDERSVRILKKLRGEVDQAPEPEAQYVLNKPVESRADLEIYGPSDYARRNGEVALQDGRPTGATFEGPDGEPVRVRFDFAADKPDELQAVRFQVADGKEVSLVRHSGEWKLNVDGQLRETDVHSISLDGIEPWLGTLTVKTTSGNTIRHNPFLDRLDISADDPLFFRSGLVPQTTELPAPTTEFVKTSTVRARIIDQQMVDEEGWYMWKNPDAADDDDWEIAKVGDYIIHPPDGGAPYVAEAQYFQDNYAEMAGFPGQYAKTNITNAVRLQKPAVVQHSQQGVTAGMPGDYLIVDANGEQYIVPRTKFEAQYAPRIVSSHQSLNPMNLPEETSAPVLVSDTPEDGKIYRSNWKHGTIMRSERDSRIFVADDRTGDIQIYLEGRLIHERRTVISDDDTRKIIQRDYPYDEIEKVNALVSPEQLNERLLNTSYTRPDGTVETLAEVRARAMSMPDTMANQSVDRLLLQQKWSEDHWNYLLNEQQFDPEYNDLNLGPPKKEKKARILMGITGSGKTSTGMADLEGQGYMVLESDDIKKRMPEYEGGVGATALRRESNMLNDRMLEWAIDEGYNFVLPGVGTDPKWMRQTIKDLHEAGWTVDLVFVDIPPSEAMNRVVSRFTQTGRFVDPAYLVTQGHVPAQTYRQVVDDTFYNGDGLSGFRHIWNLERPARTLEEGHVEPN